MYNFYSLLIHGGILDCKLESCDFLLSDMKSRLLMMLPIRDESPFHPCTFSLNISGSYPGGMYV